MRNIKAPLEQGKNYEVKMADFESTGADEDIEMGGVMGEKEKKRTEKVVVEELRSQLFELLDKGAQQLEQYDGHSRETTKQYRDYLGKTAPKGFVLPKRSGSGLAESEERRPSVVQTPVQTPLSPSRDFENDTARRGSK